MPRETSSEKYRKEVAETVLKLESMTEEEAEAYLEGKDLIFAQHCFNEVFGHYMDTN